MKYLSAREKWSYAIGNMPYSVKDTAFGSFVVFYYTQVLGLSGSLAGLAMFFALTWDAISDPLVGSWSDTLRTRWGRRHPLLIAGGIPTALLFLLVFPPDMGLSQVQMFLWLVLVSIALRTCLTLYFIPYSAMGAELSDDYDERTVIAKARVTMGWLSGIGITALAYALIFPTTGELDGRLVADNYMQYGVLSTAIALVATGICVFGTWSVIPRLKSSPVDAPGFTLGKMARDAKTAFANRNFRLKMGANLSFGAATGVYATLSLYLGTYFWEFSSEQLAGLVAPAVVATALAFMTVHKLGRYFDKHTLLAAASFVMGANFLWMVGARILGWLPENGHPIIYPLMLLTAGIGVYATVAVHVMSASLTADILDQQELATGDRQEGFFFAAMAFIYKAVTGLGALLSGIIIDLSGMQPGTEPGEVSHQVLNSLGGFTVGAIALFSFISFFFYRLIDLDRNAHRKVQDDLAARPDTTD